MKLFSSKKRVAAIGALTAATLVGGGMAYGYWTTTGTGSGDATAGTATAWSVDVPDTAVGSLTPTGAGAPPFQTVNYTIQNIGTGQQYLDKAVISVSSVTAGPVAGPNACTANDFALGAADAGDPLEQSITLNQAANATYPGTVDLRLLDNGDNQDQCQGASVTLTVVAS